MANIIERRVFGVADVRLCRFGVVEFYDYEALWFPIALDCLYVTGTCEDSSAVRSNGCGGFFGEVGLRLGVDYFNVYDYLALHCMNLFM